MTNYPNAKRRERYYHLKNVLCVQIWLFMQGLTEENHFCLFHRWLLAACRYCIIDNQQETFLPGRPTRTVFQQKLHWLFPLQFVEPRKMGRDIGWRQITHTKWPSHLHALCRWKWILECTSGKSLRKVSKYFYRKVYKQFDFPDHYFVCFLICFWLHSNRDVFLHM